MTTLREVVKVALLTGVLVWASGALASPPDGMGNGALSPHKCPDCHTCARPTPEAACLRPGLQALPPGRAHGGAMSWDEAPATIRIDLLEHLYQPVTFNHRLHASMAADSSGCVTCHHLTPTGSAHPACGNCHPATVTNGMSSVPGLKGAFHRQCLGCHREWSGKDDCEACHRLKQSTDPRAAAYPVEGYRPCREPALQMYQTTHEGTPYVTFFHANHAKRYGLVCADCHQQDPCTACHYQGKRPVSAMAPEGDLMHYKCADCHDVEAADNCTRCHSDRPQTVFDHARASGWTLGRHHALLTCASCHGGEGAFDLPEPACNGCHGAWHVGAFDHAVVGLALDENHVELECQDCHAERRFEAPPACSDCHDEKQYPRDKPGDVVPPKR